TSLPIESGKPHRVARVHSTIRPAINIQGRPVTLRQGTQSDIPGMQRVRLAVRENALTNPDRITTADYIAALEDLGRTWVVEADASMADHQPGHAGRGFLHLSGLAVVRNCSGWGYPV